MKRSCSFRAKTNQGDFCFVPLVGWSCAFLETFSTLSHTHDQIILTCSRCSFMNNNLIWPVLCSCKGTVCPLLKATFSPQS